MFHVKHLFLSLIHISTIWLFAVGWNFTRISPTTPTRGFNPSPASGSVSTVSYTHLDVYKRQGLFSRHYLTDYLEQEIERMSGEANIVLALCDIDDFKLINDCLLYTSRCV